MKIKNAINKFRIIDLLNIGLGTFLYYIFIVKFISVPISIKDKADFILGISVFFFAWISYCSYFIEYRNKYLKLKSEV